ELGRRSVWREDFGHRGTRQERHLDRDRLRVAAVDGQRPFHWRRSLKAAQSRGGNTAEDVLIRVDEASPGALLKLAFDERIDHIQVRLAQEILRFVDDHSLEAARVSGVEEHLQRQLWEEHREKITLV